jgi:hypothetical protein
LHRPEREREKGNEKERERFHYVQEGYGMSSHYKSKQYREPELEVYKVCHLNSLLVSRHLLFRFRQSYMAELVISYMVL